ncbi:SAM-dependent methyltransferase [Intrasporangium mesophilum]
MDPVPWREAWHDALYAAGRGFYVARGGPAAHFTTATHGVTGGVLAEVLLALWARMHGPVMPRVVVDLGAGRGELATHLLRAVAAQDDLTAAGTPTPTATPTATTSATPTATRIVAVDVVDRPGGLDARIEWVRSPGGADLPECLADLEDALVVAHEWLDVVPCEVAEVDGDGQTRVVLVDRESGTESLGSALPTAEADWCRDHWPTSRPRSRVEVGLARDEAWLQLLSAIRSGLAVAVDYGHLATERPSGGTLAAYVGGRLTQPVPDGSRDITAHVAMDTLAADLLVRQRDLLRDLGFTGATPSIELATTDPLAYVRALERAGAEADLIRPAGGFGDFWWAVKRVHRGDVP